MELTKNIRISLYILIPILLWMISGFFKNNDLQEPIPSSDLFNVQTVFSVAEEYQPYIKLKASTKSEKRINVKAKTSGEVVMIGAVPFGSYIPSWMFAYILLSLLFAFISPLFKDKKILWITFFVSLF